MLVTEEYICSYLMPLC
jgi:sphingomyelin phosphodiesterase